jgi:hypothetical protein
MQEVLVIHELVELVKALAWPCVVLYIVVKFQTGIKSLLNEMPRVVRRVRSAHGLGVEIELDKIGDELPVAARQAQLLSLQMPEVPAPTNAEGDE